MTLADTLTGSHTAVVRALFLASDLDTVIHEVPGTLLGGSVSMDRKREITRQASVELVNTAGVYSAISSSSLVWPGRFVRLERGALVNGVPAVSYTHLTLPTICSV